MFSLTNCLRLAARTVSHPNPTLLATRWASNNAAVGNSSSTFNRTSNDDLEKTVNDTAESAGVVPQGIRSKGTTQAFKKTQISIRQFPAGKPTNVVDFRRSGRVHNYERPPRRKPWQIGPGAKESRNADPFYQLGINPLDEAMNSRLLSHFVSAMGKMRSRATTNLTWKSQRRLGKAIRRAKMMGIIPILSKRPLISEGEWAIPPSSSSR